MPERFEVNEANPTTTSVFKTVDGDSGVNIARCVLKSEEQAVIEPLPKGFALLIAFSRPDSGARLLFNEDRANVGRRQKSDIFLNGATVSHKCAQFIRNGDEFSARDSGLFNGTYINRERVDAHALYAGDKARIGRFYLTSCETSATT